jgi:aminoglycoside 6'-N-acetyltransferase
MGDIAFAPLNESHLSLLLYWLETPHVKLWWDQDIIPITLNKLPY